MMRNNPSSMSHSKRERVVHDEELSIFHIPLTEGARGGEFELDDAAQRHLPPTPSKRGRMIHDEEQSIFHVPLKEGENGS
jgi:hypothetical protein